MSKLGVNIDHVATLRQARGGTLPDPVAAARICEEAGADGIVAHLREDRRHIQDRDLPALKKQVRRLNLEMSLNKEIIAIALRLRPAQCTLVPERRQELTTEGGLDVIRYQRRVRLAAEQLGKKGIAVSLFVDPDQRQILACAQSGAPLIELHTGRYADARSAAAQQRELVKLQRMTAYAQSLGLVVNAGHGLNYQNTRAVAQIPGIEELNIGHAIIARALVVGLAQAVREMIALARAGQ